MGHLRWLLAPALAWMCAAPAAAQSAEQVAMIERLQRLALDELGNPQIKSDFIPSVRSTPEAPHRMLIIPVEYANVGFDRFDNEPDADERNRQYFQELLFDDDVAAPREGTLTHYYRHQSKGRYLVTGEVFPIVTVAEPSDYYGRPIQNSDGQWRNDVRAETLVEDALRAAYAQAPDFPWREFDVFDPADYDGDGVYDEADGYIDHFVLVFAGRGQSSCQGLYNLQQKFTPNAPETLYDTLEPQEQECAQRIWPHRFSLTVNNGMGPEVEGFVNRRGGVPVTDGLWVYDYNMQSEYTDVSTFIHEFGHSLGLPDVYARQTNNSTAAWEAMSSTASPLPQELSAWSRLQLGWLDPCIVTPRIAGGSRVQSVYLKTMNDWAAGAMNPAGLCDAAMVILPPKIRALRMGPLDPAVHGTQAAYTGQGNDLNHFMSRTFDLREAGEGPIMLELDAWFRIEADWDYLYVQASTDGENYTRLMPTDKDDPLDTASVMPSQRGHDGLGTVPGFTGWSGDLDGDGRVETADGCDPTAERLLAEDQVGADEDPCVAAQWIHAAFDLGAYRGQEIEIRFHYFADTAAVEDGALVDNVTLDAVGFRDDFETPTFEGWRVEGFSLSPGSHDIPVPHFYLLEYRDPYEAFASAYNYDSALANPGFSFYRNADGGFEAINFRYRPGVLAWYYNGEYPWSENDPAFLGPGDGFLLLVDSTPQEFEYPSVPAEHYRTEGGWTRYEFDDGAQAWLRQAYLDVMCFQRRPEYYPLDLGEADLSACRTPDALAGERLTYDGRQLLFGYTLINELLPGEAREPYKSMGTLFDINVGRGGVSYRLYDRVLRSQHSADAPFALEPFANGLEFWRPNAAGEMERVDGVDFAGVSAFSDSDAHLNPHLPFGSAAVPDEGFGFQLAEPGAQAPEGAKVKIYFTWER
jgi:M6 family metalloprotease-like protein